jgi:hypothetical protein
MKALRSGIISAIVICGTSLAQSATPAQTRGATGNQQAPMPAQSTQAANGQGSETPRIAPGSVIPVELTKSVDAKKVKAGDQIEAKVTQDLKTGSGELLVPKDTKVLGHITEVQARNKEQKESQVGIAFDHAVMKGGDNVALPMSIQAIIGPQTQNSDNNGGGSAEPTSMPNSGGMYPGSNGARSGGMGGTSSPMPSSTTTGNEWPTKGQTNAKTHPPITGDTQGVVGIANLKLSAGANATEGSVVSSEKNNVKLDSGTLMLLRVNQ